VLQHVNLEQVTVGRLKELARQAVATQSGWKAYRGGTYDTLKIYTQAHGSKVRLT